MRAAWAVLREEGYSGFTFDAIAARAETGRAVLYRRWSRREDLLEATLRYFWEPVDMPDTGSLREDALALLRSFNERRGDMIAVLVVQLADYFRDTGNSLDDLRERFIGGPGRRSSFGALVERAVERGELVAAPDAERIANLPFELLRGNMIMHSGRVPDSEIIEIVDVIWLPLLHRPAEGWVL